jgi:competence ComEA-like helix-hairpin-helix protein
MKNAAIKFLSFTKSETRGVLVLFFLMSFLIAFPYLYISFKQPMKVDSITISDEGGSIPPKRDYLNTKQEVQNKSAEQLFTFNPNSATNNEFEALGLKAYQIKCIRKYIEKGGQFKTKKDFAKIYTLKEEWLARVNAYINLPDSITRNTFHEEIHQQSHAALREPLMVDINESDSEALEKLNGIGPYLAGKIVNYRNRLGGFSKEEQLLEIWGMNKECYEKVLPHIKLGTLQKISVNHASTEELKQHPYIRWKLANEIVAYRKQHGTYKNVDDLRPLALMADTTLAKLTPYFSFE